MRVFLSWSGERSKALAEGFGSWISQVIQAVEPWVSTGMEKGIRWAEEIASRLEEAKVGIICLTPENLNSRWILFEAGALAKIKDAHVCTLLLNLENTDIEQPLAQFNHTKAGKEDIFKLVQTINGQVNAVGEKSLTEKNLEKVFERFWPDMDATIKKLAGDKIQKPQTRSPDEMLKEILELNRNTLKILVEKGEQTAYMRLLDDFGVREQEIDKYKEVLESINYFLVPERRKIRIPGERASQLAKLIIEKVLAETKSEGKKAGQGSSKGDPSKRK